MIQITIGQDRCSIPINQVQWFNTLSHALDFGCDGNITIPDHLGDQLVTMTEFKQLVDCYQTQFTNQCVEQRRNRGLLEHYLDGVFDDLNGDVLAVHKFLRIPVGNIPLYLVIVKLVHDHPFTINHNEWRCSTFTQRVCHLGNLDLLKCVMADIDKSDLCNVAAQFGKLDILDFAHQIKCPWNQQTCNLAALSRHLNCLEYLYQNDCPWNEYVCKYAASNGDLEMLKFAHHHKCPWDASVCMYAAQDGYLDCLQYAHENGCPWDRSVCMIAGYCGYPDILKYAYEHGCPWDADLYYYIQLGCLKQVNTKNGKHAFCLQYAKSKECPYN